MFLERVYVDGDVRLVDGLSPLSGRLEVYHDNRWGTVCDDHFNEEEGRVACVQLGFTNLGEVIYDGRGITGSGMNPVK